jgi:hypothetical protein
MTSVKCRNSGVESNAGSFINLPKLTYAFRAPVSSMHSWALASLVFRLASQLSIRQSASDDLFHNAGEPLRVRHGAIIVAKRLFVQITEEMERFDAHVGPINSTLQEAPEVFHPVRVNVPVNILLRVIDDLVRVLAVERIVGEKFIGDDFRSFAHSHLYNVAEIVLAARLDMLHMNTARLALKQSEHDLLSERPASVDALGAFASVHVASLPANEGLIRFDRARHLAESAFLHREANPMVHEPRGLLGDAKPAMKLVTADSVLATNNQPRGGKPLLKRDGRVFKNGSGLQRKRRALMLGVALPYPSLCQPRHVIGPALGTDDLTVWPAKFGHELPAVLKIREPQNRLMESVWRFHESSMLQEPRYVKYIIAQVWKP